MFVTILYAISLRQVLATSPINLRRSHSSGDSEIFWSGLHLFQLNAVELLLSVSCIDIADSYNIRRIF